MACENKIVKNITSDCETQKVAGLEQVVYLINRTDIDSITYDITNKSLVTGLDLASGEVAYKLVGTKKSLNCGSERVVSDDAPDSFKHKFMFNGYEYDSASVENMDNMADVVVIVEKKDKKVEDGTFVIFGLGSGLYVSTDTSSENDSNGVRKIELTSQDGQLEKNSQNNLLVTDYATTKALLEGLL